MKGATLTLTLTTSLLFALGALMVFATTSAELLDRSSAASLHGPFLKQMGYALLSFVCAAAVFYVGHQRVLRFSGLLLLLVTLLLVCVYLPGIGMQINGAHRWIRVFGHSLQPSEFAKYLIPIYAIYAITRHKEGLRLMGFCRIAATVAVPLFLIIIEPDNGTVAIVLATLLVLVILMRVRLLYWALPLFLCALAGGYLASRMDHVADRIQIYLHPELDLRGKGHQPHQARIATGSGGLFGKGLGQSLQKMDYLPEARSDYIAAIFAEEMGFVGIVGLVLLYLSLAGSGFWIASRSKTPEGLYLAGILTFLITFQAFLNLGIVSGLLPSKGTNLPFFSHGGSSLMVNFIAIGLIASVANRRRVHG